MSNAGIFLLFCLSLECFIDIEPFDNCNSAYPKLRKRPFDFSDAYSIFQVTCHVCELGY